MTPLERLKRGRERIAGGWTTGEYYEVIDANPCYCLLGSLLDKPEKGDALCALSHYLNGEDEVLLTDFQYLLREIATSIRVLGYQLEEQDDEVAIVNFNDHEASQQEAIVVLDDTIAQLEAAS